jgi:hypothetical protein
LLGGAIIGGALAALYYYGGPYYYYYPLSAIRLWPRLLSSARLLQRLCRILRQPLPILRSGDRHLPRL